MLEETISLHEAKAHLSELIRNVREKGARYAVTWRGQRVADIIPTAQEPDAAMKERCHRAYEGIMRLRATSKPRKEGDPTIREMIEEGRR